MCVLFSDVIFPPDAHVAKAVALPATPVDAALLRAMRYVMPAHRFRAARLVSAAGAELPFDILIPLRVTPCRGGIAGRGRQRVGAAREVGAAPFMVVMDI